MYFQIWLVTSVRGIGDEPMIAASGPVGIIGFMNAAFGLRAVFFFAAFLAGALFTAFLAVFFEDFFADDFLADFFPAFFAFFFIAITFSFSGLGTATGFSIQNCREHSRCVTRS
jgi:hypothetical protein